VLCLLNQDVTWSPEMPSAFDIVCDALFVSAVRRAVYIRVPTISSFHKDKRRNTILLVSV